MTWKDETKYENGKPHYESLKKEIDRNLNVEHISELFIHEQALKVEEIERNPLKSYVKNQKYLWMDSKEI